MTPADSAAPFEPGERAGALFGLGDGLGRCFCPLSRGGSFLLDDEFTYKLRLPPLLKCGVALVDEDCDDQALCLVFSYVCLCALWFCKLSFGILYP